MTRKEEEKYLDKEWKAMNVHLKSFLENGDQEELHKFRVQIKKVRALLSLIEGTSGKKGLLREFKPVSKIFKHAGHIRDAHTNLQLGERYGLKNEVFEAGQQKIIEEGTSMFRSSGEKHLKNIKDSYKQVKKQLSKIDDNLIADFYKNLLEQIAGTLAQPDFTGEMHNSRKLIKFLVYNHKIADKALNGSLHLNSEYLDKLQSTIGEWHDNVVAAQLFASPELNDQPVVVKINKKNAGVKRRITTLANDFIRKATTPAELVNVSL